MRNQQADRRGVSDLDFSLSPGFLTPSPAVCTPKILQGEAVGLWFGVL